MQNKKTPLKFKLCLKFFIFTAVKMLGGGVVTPCVLEETAASIFGDEDW
jgi:hypothetical protein